MIVNDTLLTPYLLLLTLPINLPVKLPVNLPPQDHKAVLFENIISYDTLSHKNPLACAHLTIMCLRHAYDNFSR